MTSTLKAALIGGISAAAVVTATNALAGSGIGDVFNLGVANTVDAPSALSGNPGANPELRVTNSGAGGAGIRGDAQGGAGQLGQSQSGIGVSGIHAATTGTSPGVQGATNSTDAKAAGVVGKNLGGGAGLSAVVKTGAPPLAVNSQGKVANLNADQLDGVDSTGFVRGKGNAYRWFAQGCYPLCSVSVAGFGTIYGSWYVAGADCLLTFINESGETLNASWWNKDGVGYSEIAAGDGVRLTPFTTSDYLVLFQVGRDDRMATITTSLHDTGTGCVVKSQGLVQIG